MKTPKYTVRREKVTWIRWDPTRLRDVVTHPVKAIVYEDEEWVGTFDTVREARDWIAEQGGEQR